MAVIRVRRLARFFGASYCAPSVVCLRLPALHDPVRDSAPFSPVTRMTSSFREWRAICQLGGTSARSRRRYRRDRRPQLQELHRSDRRPSPPPVRLRPFAIGRRETIELGTSAIFAPARLGGARAYIYSRRLRRGENTRRRSTSTLPARRPPRIGYLSYNGPTEIGEAARHRPRVSPRARPPRDRDDLVRPLPLYLATHQNLFPGRGARRADAAARARRDEPPLGGAPSAGISRG